MAEQRERRTISIDELVELHRRLGSLRGLAVDHPKVVAFRCMWEAIEVALEMDRQRRRQEAQGAK